jgi:putative DNA or RNA helicase of superfamily II
VLSDDSRASERIAEFSAGDDRWMVAVRMVSEGVDVPRLAVGVYATSASTPLFFAQAIGRFVRARRRGETATVFLPSVPQILELAAGMEVERDHAIDRPGSGEDGLDDDLIERANRQEQASDQLAFPGFEALGSDAAFDRALFDGGEFGLGAEVGSDEEADFLGIPGLLEPEQVTSLLRRHQAEQSEKRTQRPAPPASDARRRRDARKELSSLVSAWAQKSGQPHAFVHAELRRICGGPEVARASVEQIEARIDRVRRWFVGRT